MAERIREYIAAVEEGLEQTGALNETTVQWIAWARSKADNLDPFTRDDPSIEEELSTFVVISHL